MNKNKKKYFALFKFEKSDFFGISFLLLILLAIIFFKHQFSLKSKEVQLIQFKEIQIVKDTVSSIKSASKPIEPSEKKNVFSNVKNKTKSVPKKIIDINLANQHELKLINGIGDVFSSRIIKYRNLLGGFYKTEQLKEVYGINEEVYNKVVTQIKCNKSFIKKRDLNALEFKEMLKHPYFDYNEVKKIFDLKNNHELKNLETLKDKDIVSVQKFENLNYYFKVLDSYDNK